MEQEAGSAARAISPPAPDVGSCYGHGFGKLKEHFLELLAVALLVIVLAIPFCLLCLADDVFPFGGLFGGVALLYGLIVIGPAEYGVAFASLKSARGVRPQVKDVFVPLQNYLNVVVAFLLVEVIVGIGFLLLIVPGIIFACKLAFVPYLVVERKLDPAEAIRESWRMTKGHAVDIFLIGLLAIPIFIAGGLIIGVGAIVAVIWIRLALASMYYSVSAGQTKPAAEAAPTP